MKPNERATPGSNAPAGASVVLLGALLLCSGVGSLALEVVWTRMLRLAFGSTTLAVATILVAYMLGLGLGGLAGGAWSRRPERGVAWYGWLELGIGVYALFVPFALDALPGVASAMLPELGFWPGALLRFALSLAVLIAPTIAMGATLPLLVSVLVRDPNESARGIGLLYGLNTAGAVIGTFGTTFALFPLLGLWGANAAGAALDLAVGTVALVWVAPRVAAPAVRAKSPAPAEPAVRRFPAAVLAYAVVGFTSLVYEVAWTRALSLALGSSIYAFATMLGAFLSGIALGSLAGRRGADRSARPLELYVGGIALLGALSFATMLLLPWLPSAFLLLGARVGFTPAATEVLHLVLAFAVMLPPTLVLGALFPLLCRLRTGSGSAGLATGDVYAANTLGSATGAFSAGFLLIPWLGLQGTLVLAVATNFATAGALWLLHAGVRSSRRSALGAGSLALAAALVAAPLPWNTEALTAGFYRAPVLAMEYGIELEPLEGEIPPKLLFYRDGLSGTVSVHEERGRTYLRINGKTEAGTARDMQTQVLSAHIPLLFGAPARSALVIGYASGITVGSAARHPLERIDAVEIEPAVLEASRFFDPVSGAPLDDPRVRVTIDDGRTFLAYTRERYDAIISEPSNPWLTGVANLFTREYFHAVRGALAPGGRLLQWLPLYGVDQTSVKAILAALRAEFPHVYGIASRYRLGDFLVLAGTRPLAPAELPRMESLAPAVRADLERVEVYSDEDLWSLVRLIPADIDAWLGPAPEENTDGNLLVELRAPRTLYADTVDANWSEFTRFPAGVAPLLIDLGVALDGEGAGALALSYAVARRDPVVANTLALLAQRRGGGGSALAVEALLSRELTREQQLAKLDAAVAAGARPCFVRLARAEARIGAGRPAEALDDIEACAAAKSDLVRARALRAVALQALGRFEQAALDIDATLAATLDPDVGLLNSAAEIYLQAGRTREGVALLERSLERDPQVGPNWQRLAGAYRALGREENAARAERNAPRATRNQLYLAWRDARRARWLGQSEQARVLLERILQLDPSLEGPRADLEALRGGGT